MNIYVGNLPYSVRDEELRSTFEAFGKVASAEVIFDKRTRRSRGYGFVDMINEAEALRAISALNGQELHGRELRVDASQPKTEDSSAPAARTGQSNRGPRPSNSRPAAGPAASNDSAPPAGIKGFFKRLFG